MRKLNWWAGLIWAIFMVAMGAQIQAAQVSPHGELKWDCQVCHTAEEWNVLRKPLKFNHDDTGFPLQGKHLQANCRDCHQDLHFSRIATQCIDCHQDVHRNQFGLDCQQCHSPVDWRPEKDIFELHASRGFSLMGVHANVDCQACHVGEQQMEFRGTPLECQGCHQADFQQTTNPDHARAGFNTDCQSCHQPFASSWNQTTFRHPEVVELKGIHFQLDCNQCHSQTFAGTPRVCFSCHQQDYQATSNPSHAVFGFPTDCENCHQQTTWMGAFFDHVQQSGFALEGAHAHIQCLDCHVNNQMVGLPRDCFGCHDNDFQTVTDPNHVQNNFSHDCTQCHTTDAWEPATFDHNQTNFPLTGAHLNLQCIDCHSAGYAGMPFDCYSCHQADYQSVGDPSHVQNNFSHDCTQCHTTDAWQPATFDHNQTNFPLTGAHLNLQCIDCHSAGYAGTPFDCYSCHQADYQGVGDPNHVQNNFSHDCTQCHTTDAWQPATFDHNQTNFPLTGAHLNLQCIDCHSAGYAGTPYDCYSCHQNDYQATTNPNHQAAGFPVQCETCHNTSNWNQTTWDHDNQYFPIYSGEHQGEWNNCSDCHVYPGNYQAFECIYCHEHNQQEMDDEHQGVPNYQYNSLACYNCHPDGESR